MITEFYDTFDDTCMTRSSFGQSQVDACMSPEEDYKIIRSSDNEIEVKEVAKKEEPVESEGDECIKNDSPFDHIRDMDEAMLMGAWWPAVDAKETECSYEIYVELPGVKKENVKVELHEDESEKYLIVGGTKVRTMNVPEIGQKDQRKKKKYGTWEKWHRKERVFGHFERAFSIPIETEWAEIQANFENGVLAVTFPKHQVVSEVGKDFNKSNIT